MNVRISSPLRAGVSAWTLANSLYRSSSAVMRWKNKIRWVLLAALSPQESLSWFDWVSRNEILPFFQKIPYLIFAPLRVFMSTKWNIAQRKKVISDTYQFILAKGTLRDAILCAEGSMLARIYLEGYGDIEVILCHNTGLRKEGSLMVSLKSVSSQKSLFKLAFSIERRSSEKSVGYIGCIQGFANKDEVKVLTKAMHGLRPNALMILVAQELMGALGVTNLCGISNAIHPHNHKHLIHIPLVHLTTFDYDSLWMELGGVLMTDGWFTLPLKASPRLDQEIKSNKRAMYRRRYAMMDDLSGQLQASIGDRRE